MNPLRNLQLTAGPVPLLLLLAGAAALAGLMSASRSTGSARTVLACAGAALAVTALADYLVEFVWKPFPDRLDPLVLLWIALGVLALLLAAVRSAVLWRQMGGSLWDFVFGKRAMIEAVDRGLR